jgi:hypothetical protein
MQNATAGMALSHKAIIFFAVVIVAGIVLQPLIYGGKPLLQFGVLGLIIAVIVTLRNRMMRR